MSAGTRKLIYDKLDALLRSSDGQGFGYGDELQSGDEGYMQLLDAGVIADSTGKRIPMDKGKKDYDRAAYIAGILEKGDPIYVYKKGELFPRRVSFFKDSGSLVVSDKPVTQMTPMEEPKRPTLWQRYFGTIAAMFGRTTKTMQAWKRYQDELAARKNVTDPKRINRRLRNDPILSKRGPTKNTSSKEAYQSFVAMMKNEMGFEGELNAKGNSELANLMQDGVILDAAGESLTAKGASQQDLIDSIGNHLYKKGEPLFVYRKGEKYPREIYLDEFGSLKCSEKTINEASYHSPKLSMADLKVVQEKLTVKKMLAIQEEQKKAQMEAPAAKAEKAPQPAAEKKEPVQEQKAPAQEQKPMTVEEQIAALQKTVQELAATVKQQNETIQTLNNKLKENPEVKKDAPETLLKKQDAVPLNADAAEAAQHQSEIKDAAMSQNPVKAQDASVQPKDQPNQQSAESVKADAVKADQHSAEQKQADQKQAEQKQTEQTVENTKNAEKAEKEAVDEHNAQKEAEELTKNEVPKDTPDEERQKIMNTLNEKVYGGKGLPPTVTENVNLLYGDAQQGKMALQNAVNDPNLFLFEGGSAVTAIAAYSCLKDQILGEGAELENMAGMLEQKGCGKAFQDVARISANVVYAADHLHNKQYYQEHVLSQNGADQLGKKVSDGIQETLALHEEMKKSGDPELEMEKTIGIGKQENHAQKQGHHAQKQGPAAKQQSAAQPSAVQPSAAQQPKAAAAASAPSAPSAGGMAL